jgi:formylglycine-generating enzyme
MKNFSETVKNAIFTMIAIEGGSFLMGDAKIPTTVSDFWIGATPVTQKQYTAVMGSNPLYFKGDNFPLEFVSWYDAIDFCNKLSQMENRQPFYQSFYNNMGDIFGLCKSLKLVKP